MSNTHPRRRLVLLTLAALVACTSDPVTLCGCSPVPPAGRVYGVVRGPDGAAVSGALVRAQASGAECAAPFREIGQGATDARGRFSMEVYQVFDTRPPGVCLRAYADPPAASTLAASDTLPFRVDFTQAAALDSARVDLVLRAR